MVNAPKKEVRIRAPAKINLRLEVLGLREDNYHEILSWVYPVSLWDEIRLERIEKGVYLECDHPQVPEEDLSVKAAKLFLRYTGLKMGIKIKLKKNIPIGSGLGGGSSDAASTLRGLMELSGFQLEEKELFELGSQLGSDIPFFLKGKPALIGGRGERIIQELPPLKLFLVILYPKKPLSSSAIYRLYDLSLTKGGGENRIIRDFPPRKWEEFLYNALEEVAERVLPEIKEMKNLLRQKGAKGVLMTGSGSAVFGIYEREEEARSAFEFLKAFDWEVFLVETL
jgi:4-diphosphocytidyl-2-C-methyl-D-erythritol kinase